MSMIDTALIYNFQVALIFYVITNSSSAQILEDQFKTSRKHYISSVLFSCFASKFHQIFEAFEQFYDSKKFSRTTVGLFKTNSKAL